MYPPSSAPLFIARLILGGLSLFFSALSSCGHEVTSQIFGQRRSEADSWHLISALDLAGASGMELEGGRSCRCREKVSWGSKGILILAGLSWESWVLS